MHFCQAEFLEGWHVCAVPFLWYFCKKGASQSRYAAPVVCLFGSCPPGVEKGCAMSFSTEFSTGFSTGRSGSSGKYGAAYILLIIN